MGYFTYRIFRGVTLERLTAKVRANLSLYDAGTAGRALKVKVIEGAACSSLLLGYLLREEDLLMPVGYQLGCVWMDARWQDGDW